MGFKNPMDYKDYKQKNEKDLHFWFKAKINFIDKLLSSTLTKKNNKILDLGCGTGTELAILSKYGEVTALDSNQNATRITRDLGYKTIDADIQSYNFENKYDLICCFDLLEHLDNDKLVLKKINQALQDKGFFIFTVPAYQWLFSPHDKFLEHKRRYSKQEIKEKLINAGFKIKKLAFWNSLLFPLIIPFRLLKIIIQKSHPSKNFKNESTTPNKFLNNFLFFILNLEKEISLSVFSLPFGLSIYGITKK